MKNKYKNIQDFLEDVHKELSIKETIIQMGLMSEDDFRGNFAHCIFHDGDHTPSLQVTNNFFKCYACGQKGDLISFITAFYNTDFIDAVKKLADFLHISIESTNYEGDSLAKDLKEEQDLYIKDMKDAPAEAKEMQRIFFPQQIGYDKKIKYVTMPYTSKSGQILGFTKRRVDALVSDFDTNPKWKHSSQNDSLISKCQNIFNLGNASSEIRKKGFVILVEGPKDAIAYRKIGIDNVLAISGTNNVFKIWDIVLPVKKIVLSFDGDNPGIHATLDAIEELVKLNFQLENIEVVKFDNEDPYDALNHLEESFNNKISAIDFYINNCTKGEASKLYSLIPEYNNMYFLKSVCKQLGYSVSEAESWLYNENGHNNEENKVELTEKEILIAIVEGKDIDVPLIADEEKAKKILKLKYGVTYEN